jgi:hypothetical protein
MKRRVFLGTMLVAAVAAPGQARAQAAPAGAAEAAAVRLLATRLREGYVIPPTGVRYAEAVERRLAAGGYAGLSGARLADALTADLQAVARDGHLRVRAVPPDAAEPGPERPRSGPPRAPALQDAGWIADGVGYLRYTNFLAEADAMAGTRAFLASHGRARALILDCRYNGGGGMAEMDLLLPQLFAAPTRLVAFEMADAVARARGVPFDEPSVRPAASAPGTVRREHWATPPAGGGALKDARVFYLVSGRTASAAEHLALALKRTGRATLIGAATAGANHFGDDQPLGAGLSVFLPVGRTIDPDTGADWEGTGIAPDVAVPPAAALEEALRRARQA